MLAVKSRLADTEEGCFEPRWVCADLVKRICQTSHELGLHELWLLVGELRLLLHLESCGLHAELADLVVAGFQVLQV